MANCRHLPHHTRRRRPVNWRIGDFSLFLFFALATCAFYGKIRAMSATVEPFKVSFRSYPEVVEAFSGVTARFRARNLRLGPAGPAPEGAIFSRQVAGNALLLWFCALPPAEQERILREGMTLLAPLAAAAVDTPGARPGGGG